MVRHIVSWNFKEEIPEEKRAEIRETLAAAFPTLVGKIPGLLNVSVGMPPLGSSNCDLALYCEMEEEKDLAVYREDVYKRQDYDLQKFGPSSTQAAHAAEAMDGLLCDLIDFLEREGVKMCIRDRA